MYDEDITEYEYEFDLVPPPKRPAKGPGSAPDECEAGENEEVIKPISTPPQNINMEVVEIENDNRQWAKKLWGTVVNIAPTPPTKNFWLVMDKPKKDPKKQQVILLK